jgi:hypothetical protein
VKITNFSQKLGESMHQTLFESDTISLNYLKTERLLELIWKKNPSSTEFREIFTSALQFAQSHKISFFLSDMRNEGLIDLNNLKWLESEIIPAAIKIGIKKIAMVSEETFYSTLYAEIIKKKLENSPIQVRILAVRNEATDWLLTS